LFALSDDGVLTFGRDDKARLWGLDGNLRSTLDVGQANSASFSPDGRLIAIGTQTGTVSLWDATSGQQVTAIQAHTGYVHMVAFGQDGRTFVTGGEDGQAIMWDTTGAQVSRLLGHRSEIRTVAISPDSTTVLTAGLDDDAILWRRDGTIRFTLHGHTAAINAARFNPDGSRVVTASVDGTARIWDVQTGVAVALLAGHGGEVLDARYSPDGARVATSSFDGSTRLWDTAREEPTGIVHFEGDPPADLLALGQGLTLGAPWLALHTPIAFSALRSTAAWVTSDGVFVLLDATGTRVRPHPAPEEPPSSIAFSPDGASLVSSGEHGIELWSVADGHRVADRRANGMNRVVYSASGRLLAIASEDRAYVLDAASLDPLTEVHRGEPVSDVAFSPDDRRLVTASNDHTVRVWDARDGKELVRLPHEGAIWTARFSPNGEQVVTAGQDGARIWDTRAPLLVGTLEGHAGIVTSASYSDDGLFVVTTSYDKTARLWDARTQRHLMTFVHPDRLVDARFAHDGVHLLTERVDGGLEIWSIPKDTRSSVEVQRFVRCSVSVAGVDGLPRRTQATGSR
jgi:WD40 repeat protein